MREGSNHARQSSDERFAYDQQIIERERQMDDLSSHKTSILNLLEDLGDRKPQMVASNAGAK